MAKRCPSLADSRAVAPMAGGVEAGDAVDDGGERGPLVLLDEPPVADVLEPPVGDVGGDFLHGVKAEVAAVGEDRGEQRADIPGVDPLLAGLLEVDAEPEVVLDLDEQVGQPDSATAGVQPAVQLGEALRLRRVGLLGRVRLQPPPCVVERDLPVVSDTLQEAVERIRQAGLQVVDRRVGVDGESGARPERLADPLPLGGGQEEGLEAAEVLRALDGEVAGLELVAHLEEQRALPASAVRHAVAAAGRARPRIWPAGVRSWSTASAHRRPRPAVLRPHDGADGLAGVAALPKAALALGVRHAHGSRGHERSLCLPARV